MLFAERDRLWPRIMRWEACYFALWSKTSLLNREERKQADADIQKLAEGAPAIGDAQSPFRENETLNARHAAFVQKIVSAFGNHGISAQTLTPAEALVAIREAMYPETADSGWKPSIQGTTPMPPPPRGQTRQGRRRLGLVAVPRQPAVLCGR